MSSRALLSRLEYHIYVRHSIPASVALFSLLLLPAAFVSTTHAQINGAPASVTSPGFGGRSVNGPPASVTSLGRNGYSPNSRATFTAPVTNPRDGHHHHHHYVQYAPSAVYAVPVPYAVDIGDTEDNTDDSDADYQGGPTIFDRRGSGANSYVPTVRDAPAPHAQRAEDDPPPAPDPPQEPTLLVFKDGHKIE